MELLIPIHHKITPPPQFSLSDCSIIKAVEELWCVLRLNSYVPKQKAKPRPSAETAIVSLGT